METKGHKHQIKSKSTTGNSLGGYFSSLYEERSPAVEKASFIKLMMQTCPSVSLSMEYKSAFPAIDKAKQRRTIAIAEGSP